jgi:hypothetical protein
MDWPGRSLMLLVDVVHSYPSEWQAIKGAARPESLHHEVKSCEGLRKHGKIDDVIIGAPPFVLTMPLMIVILSIWAQIAL